MSHRVSPLLAAITLGFTWGVMACGTEPVALTCTTNAQCFTNSGYACDTTVTQTCLAQCATNTDCLGSEYCDGTVGLCRFSNIP